MNHNEKPFSQMTSRERRVYLRELYEKNGEPDPYPPPPTREELIRSAIANGWRPEDAEERFGSMSDEELLDMQGEDGDIE